MCVRLVLRVCLPCVCLQEVRIDLGVVTLQPFAAVRVVVLSAVTGTVLLDVDKDLLPLGRGSQGSGGRASGSGSTQGSFSSREGRCYAAGSRGSVGSRGSMGSRGSVGSRGSMGIRGSLGSRESTGSRASSRDASGIHEIR